MTTSESGDAPKNGLREKVQSMSAPALRALIIAAAAVALGAVLLIDVQEDQPELTSVDVGLVSNNTITATHDFSFARTLNPDIETERRAARESISDIWDYNLDVQQSIVNSVRPAFYPNRCSLYNEARNELEMQQTEPADEPQDAPAQGGEVPAAGGAATAAGGGAAPPAAASATDDVDCRYGDTENILSSQQRIDLLCSNAMRSQTARDLGINEYPVELCEVLAAAGYTAAIESRLRETLLEIMQRHIVPLKDDLPSGESVTLRRVMGGAENPAMIDEGAIVSDFSNFIDLEEARELARSGDFPHFEANETEVDNAVRELAARAVRVNTRLNASATDEARREAAQRVYTRTEKREFRRGQQIVASGEEVTPEVLEIVEQMNATAPTRVPPPALALGTLLLMLLCITAFSMQSRGQRVEWNVKDLALTAVVLVMHGLVTRLGIVVSEIVVDTTLDQSIDLLLAAMPFAAGAMVVRILTRSQFAAAFTVLYAILVGVMLDMQFIWAVTALVSSGVGIAAVRSAHSRTDILKASAVVGAVTGTMMLVSLALKTLSPGTPAALVVVCGLASSITTALMVNALLLPLELLFRYTTSLKLLELTNLNHPLLRDLLIKAPGSYHHSMMVAQLVEAGCEAVGADSLLGRVGAYYHDVGKMKSPHYFAENQRAGQNPHDKLKPSMSALILKAHVRDGVEMAKQHNLPPELIGFIREHHGTSLIRYFYHKAQQANPDGVREEEYRYPGPKPQTRETAICMLADGVEAATRSLPDKSEAHIKGLVNKLINGAFTDEQLDECDLTLRDLDAIAKAFIRRLLAMHHQRPTYPGGSKSSGDNRKKQNTASNEQVPSPSDSEEPSDGAPSSDAQAEPGDRREQAPENDDAHADGDESEGDEESKPELRRLGI